MNNDVCIAYRIELPPILCESESLPYQSLLHYTARHHRSPSLLRTSPKCVSAPPIALFYTTQHYTSLLFFSSTRTKVCKRIPDDGRLISMIRIRVLRHPYRPHIPIRQIKQRSYFGGEEVDGSSIDRRLSCVLVGGDAVGGGDLLEGLPPVKAAVHVHDIPGRWEAGGRRRREMGGGLGVGGRGHTAQA